MARVAVPIIVTNPTTGIPVSGASVTITRRSTEAAITWYPTEVGGSGSTAALSTNSRGRVTAWVDRGNYNLNVTGGGLTAYSEPWDAVPASNGAVDQGWVSEHVLTVGALKLVASLTLPTGWLACNGAAVSRATYAALFTEIGTTFGVGDGTTTFNLPDFRGRVPVAAGAGFSLTARTVGQTGGTETETISIAQMPAHGHTVVTAGSHSHGGITGAADRSLSHAHSYTERYSIHPVLVNGGSQFNVSGWPADAFGYGTGGEGAPDHLHGISADGGHNHTLNNTGTDTAHNNMQPFSVVNYIIKV